MPPAQESPDVSVHSRGTSADVQGRIDSTDARGTAVKPRGARGESASAMGDPRGRAVLACGRARSARSERGQPGETRVPRSMSALNLRVQPWGPQISPRPRHRESIRRPEGAMGLGRVLRPVAVEAPREIQEVALRADGARRGFSGNHQPWNPSATPGSRHARTSERVVPGLPGEPAFRAGCPDSGEGNSGVPRRVTSGDKAVACLKKVPDGGHFGFPAPRWR